MIYSFSFRGFTNHNELCFYGFGGKLKDELFSPSFDLRDNFISLHPLFIPFFLKFNTKRSSLTYPEALRTFFIYPSKTKLKLALQQFTTPFSSSWPQSSEKNQSDNCFMSLGCGSLICKHSLPSFLKRFLVRIILFFYPLKNLSLIFLVS